MRVCVLLIVSLLWLKANAQEDVDSSAWELVIPVEISESRNALSNIVKLSRNDFLSMPASFDDPSRLLVKFPGFSNSNDQNNGIIYHGMPAWMSGWSLYGSEILNPNHLSAAGTFNDKVSASSGGVNAFSGQVIGKYTYRANPDIHTTNDYFAGVSDIKLRDPYKNQISLNTSLIGMEAGIDLKSKHWDLMTNARYSTVGLLSLLGADFGGEEIDYQDVTAKLSYHKDDITLNLYSLYGSSSNFKKADYSNPRTEDDYITRLQQEKISVSGLNLTIDKENFLIEFTSNYSRQNKEHETIRDTPLIPSGSRTRGGTDNLVSSNFSYTKFKEKMDWEINFRSKYNWRKGSNYYYLLNQIGLLNKYYLKNRLYIYSGVSGLFFKERFDDKNSINYSLGLTWIDRSYNYKASLKISRNTQLGKTPYDLYGYNYLTKSYNLLLDLNDQKRHISYGIFGHVFRELPIISVPSDYLGMLNIFNSYEVNSGWQNLHYDYKNNNALVLGLSISKKIKFSEKIYSDVNWTFIRARHRENNGDDTFRSFRLPFAAAYNCNFLLSYQDIITHGLALSLSTSIRDGFNTGFTEPDADPFSEKTPIYFRTDARVNYTFDTKRKKYSSMLSLDIQNLTGRKNIVGYYYDNIAEDVLPKKQLGFLPVLSWRVVI